ncbi:MAG: hypothetical protein HY904_14410 [Deltaproteobacteria bacterium]|nr:hypothetical protein [Deltaproteobacteria bacterium]
MTELVLDVARSSRQQVVEAIVLAFRHSLLGSLFKDDRMANLFTENWSKISPREGVLSIKGMMDVFKAVPGYDFDKALPALCRLKTWEPYLKMQVEVPGEFVMKKIIDYQAKAASCRVPDTELAKVLPSAAQALSVFSGRARPISARQPVVTEAAPPRGRAVIMIVAGVLAGLLVAGGGAAFLLTRETPQPVAVALVSDEIPLASAERLGDTVTARLKDRVWLTFPKADRHEQVTRTLERSTRIPRVMALKLVDEAGKVVAEGRLVGTQSQVELRE